MRPLVRVRRSSLMNFSMLAPAPIVKELSIRGCYVHMVPIWRHGRQWMPGFISLFLIQQPPQSHSSTAGNAVGLPDAMHLRRHFYWRQWAVLGLLV